MTAMPDNLKNSHVRNIQLIKSTDHDMLTEALSCITSAQVRDDYERASLRWQCGHTLEACQVSGSHHAWARMRCSVSARRESCGLSLVGYRKMVEFAGGAVCC